MKAMIFAAGLGTRLRPLTDRIPKALIPVGGTPLLDLLIRKMSQEGVADIVINVHHHADLMKQHIKTLQQGGTPRLWISDESDQLLDTGGGIKKAASFFEQDEAPFLVHNVDILSNVSLKDFYECGRSFDATLLVSERSTFRYLLFDDSGCLKGWINEKTGQIKSPYPDLDPATCKKYAFSGIHTFSPKLFPLMVGWPDKFSIIDFYLSVCDRVHIQGICQPDLKLMDIGKPETLPLAGDFLKSIM